MDRRNLETDLAPLGMGRADFGQAGKLPEELRIGVTELPVVVALAIGQLRGHLPLPVMVAGFVIFPASRSTEAQQDEQQEAAEADGKEPFGEGHAARSGFARGAPNTRSSAVTLPFVASTIARIMSDEGFCSPYRMREIVGADVRAFSASAAAVLPGRLRYSSNVMRYDLHRM